MELAYQQAHRYRYDELIAETPNSSVFKAQDLVLKRDIALKRILITGNNQKEKAAHLRQAMQEIEAMVQVSDWTTGVPIIYGTHYDPEASSLFIVMQWIRGKTLREKMNSGVSLKKDLEWICRLCRILDIMSQRRMSHKDIKPENIMITDSDALYLIDFNLSISIPDLVSGTSGYKPPEMDFGSLTTDRSRVDMFSIGVMLYEMSTGHRPTRGIDYELYDGLSSQWTMFKLPHEYQTRIEPKLEEIIIKLMAFNPNDRYYSYSKLISDIRTVERNMNNGYRRER